MDSGRAPPLTVLVGDLDNQTGPRIQPEEDRAGRDLTTPRTPASIQAKTSP